jgi:hypothetical protein
MGRLFSVHHECFQNRNGIPETFPEHWQICAQNLDEALEAARQMPLDDRRRRLVSVTEMHGTPSI